jgi:hypothetical protein
MNSLGFLALTILDAGGALAVEQNARSVRAGDDMQVLAIFHEGMDVAPRSTPSFAVLLRHLIDAETFLFRAVEVLIDPELRFARRLQINLLNRIIALQLGDAERSALP